jgi:hypothetical protein
MRALVLFNLITVFNLNRQAAMTETLSCAEFLRHCVASRGP